MNSNVENLSAEEPLNVPIDTKTNDVINDDFVDVFFDEPQDEAPNVATEEDIVKPIKIDTLPDDESVFIEEPINGDTENYLKFDSEKIEPDKDVQPTDQIGAPIVDLNNDEKISTNDDEIVSFDDFINNLSENVVGANKYISEVLDEKRVIETKEKELLALKEKIETQERDFAKHLANQNKILETSRKQIDDYIQGEKLRLESEIVQFKTEADSTRSELVLLEENLRMKQQQLDSEKEQFEKHVSTESEIISDGQNKLENDRKQFEKEKALAQESIKNGNKELKIKQEEFKQYKEFEERKLELESQNLAKSCARFKQIVAQLNSGFSQLTPKE